MDISHLKNKNIHLVECENWHDVYGYEKSEMKEGVIKYIEQLQHENKRLDEVNCKLRKTNEQLKDNWHMLKEYLTNRYNNGSESISYRQVFIQIREAMQVLEITQDLETRIQELKQGSEK